MLFVAIFYFDNSIVFAQNNDYEVSIDNPDDKIDIIQDVSNIQNKAEHVDKTKFNVSLSLKGNEIYEPMDLAIIHDLTYESENDTGYYLDILNSVVLKLKEEKYNGRLIVIPAKNGIVRDNDVVLYDIASFQKYDKKPYRNSYKYSDNSIQLAYEKLLNENSFDALIFIGYGDGIVGGTPSNRNPKIDRLKAITNLQLGIFSQSYNILNFQESMDRSPITRLITDRDNIYQIEKSGSTFSNKDQIVNSIVQKFEDKLQRKKVKNGELTIPINQSLDISNIQVTLNGIKVNFTYKNGSIVVSGLNLTSKDELKVNYSVSLKDGFESNEDYSVHDVATLKYNNEIDNFNIQSIVSPKIKIKINTKNIEVVKNWDNGGYKTDVPLKNIIITLYENNNKIDRTLELYEYDKKWKGSFTDLPLVKNNKNLDSITYTVKEQGEDNGVLEFTAKGAAYKYKVNYDYSESGKVTITNSLDQLKNNLFIENNILYDDDINAKNLFDVFIKNDNGEFVRYNGDYFYIDSGLDKNDKVKLTRLGNNKIELKHGDKAYIVLDVNTEFYVVSYYNNEYEKKAVSISYKGEDEKFKRIFNGNNIVISTMKLSMFDENNLTILFRNNNYDLVDINKIVKGNGANFNDEFGFSFEVKKEGDEYSSGSFKMTHNSTELFDKEPNVNIYNGKKFIVPYGYTISITEKENDYSTKSNYSFRREIQSTKSISYKNGIHDVANQIDITFTNTKEILVPTGIIEYSTPSLIALGIATTYIVYSILKRKSSIEEEYNE